MATYPIMREGFGYLMEKGQGYRYHRSNDAMTEDLLLFMMHRRPNYPITGNRSDEPAANAGTPPFVQAREDHGKTQNSIWRYAKQVMIATPPANDTPISRSPGVPLGTFDVVIRRDKGKEVKGRANFFYNHQHLGSVWIELPADLQNWPPGTELELIAPDVLQPFPVSISGIHMAMQDGLMTACAVVDPLREPIESVASPALQHVSCAVLDSPISKHGLHKNGGVFKIQCAQFEAVFTLPSDAHSSIASKLGSTPHVLNQSITLRERGGQSFSSNRASTAINTVHDILSFAAGRWVGLTLIEGFDSSTKRCWFQFGTTKSSDAYHQVSWFDQDHPEWLTDLCDALLKLQTDEQAEDIMRRVLYWYARSNANGVGVDGALILTQCALELLSWFVIVKRTRALSEGGYGQLGDASEKLRLMLSLLGIPAHLPPGLTKLGTLNREWKTVAEAIVKGRNYLVHPTQSRSGKLTEAKKYPWYELWVVGRWVLELVILRLLDYKGEYQNRTRLLEFQRVDRVPWAH